MSLKLINNLRIFFGSNARSGTSTLVKQISQKHDVIILAGSDRSKHQDFKECKNVISLTDLNSNKGSLGLYFGNKLPIMIDNFTVIRLIEMSELEIASRDDSIRKLNSKIKEKEYNHNLDKKELTFQILKNINYESLIKK